MRRGAAAIATADRQLGWAPIFAAIAIDLADFATAGPLGLVAGLLVGGVLTTAVASLSGARFRRAIGLGVLGAIYCALPLTELIPLATMLTALHGLVWRRRHAASAAAEPTDASEPAKVPEPIGSRVIQAGPGQRDPVVG